MTFAQILPLTLIVSSLLAADPAHVPIHCIRTTRIISCGAASRRS